MTAHNVPTTIGIKHNAHSLVSCGSKARYLGQTNLSNGTDTGLNVTLKQTTAVSINGLHARFGNVYNSGSVEAEGPNDITLRASINWYDTSQGVGSLVYWPLFFNGQRDITLKPGAIVDSDLLGIRMPAGSSYWIRIYLTVTSGDKWPNGVFAIAGDDGISKGTSESDMTTSGSFSALGANTLTFGPLGIFTPRRDTTPSIAIVGDSIPGGSGDSPSNDYGFAVRALEGEKPFVPATIPGSQTGQFNHYRGKYRLRLVNECTHAIYFSGANDLSAGDSLATLQSDELNAWTLLYELGQTVYSGTLLPRSTSTDSWATLGNQTTVASNTVRVNYNNWLRAGAPIDPTTKAAVAIGTSGALTTGQYGHPLHDYFEFADAVESSRDSGKWKVDGSANYATADGLHPSAAMHALMAALIDPDIFVVS